MRFIRISIKNYRGTEESTIKFPEDADVTIIEGPNEAGKTSHIEAVDFLLTELATSKKQALKALQPVDKDAGPEVELEARCGKYWFTYTKRFLKDTMTKLVIHEPDKKNHVGREAHDRANEILEETIDLDFWHALRIVQGAKIQQADLRKKGLVKALDEAAGSGVSIGEEEQDLFEAIKTESGKHWTKKGAEKDEVKGLREQVVEAIETEEKIWQEIEAVRSDVQALQAKRLEDRNLQDSLTDLTEKLAELEKRAREADEARTELSEEERSLETLVRDLETATTTLEARKKLQSELEQGRASLKKLEEEFQAIENEEKEAESEEKALRDQIREVEKQVKEIAAEVKVREQDVLFRRSRLNRDLFSERLQKAEEAQRRLQEAKQELETNELDEGALATIENKSTALKVAEARFADEAARLEMTARGHVEVRLKGDKVELPPDEPKSWNVTEGLDFELPGLLEIKIAPGSSTHDLQAKLDRARKDLEETLGHHNVGSLEEARATHKRFVSAVQDEEKCKTDLDESLRDLSMDELRAKMKDAKRLTEQYPSQRESDLPLPSDLEDAKRLLENAKERLEEQTHTRDALRSRLDSAHETRKQSRADFLEKKTLIDVQKQRVDEQKTELETEEETAPEAVLQKAQKDAQTRYTEKKAQVEKKRKVVHALDPDSLNVRVENAKKSLRSCHDRRIILQADIHTIEGRLQARGRDGLADALAQAKRKREHLERRLRSKERKAAAAKLLFEVFDEKRRDATRAYVAPLEEKIKDLGRLVYGPSFSVRIGEELFIQERTMDGKTLSFDQLSGGVKEQLVIIHRLACASIAAKTQGVPVILDDTLGQTDGIRLEGMGAALAKTSEVAQVILLTCAPERFRHVGGAKSIPLPSTAVEEVVV